MNSVVISLGGLRVHFLGCYGGAWVATPAFDRFAAEGFVFDECFVESPSPEVTRWNWWTACYQIFRTSDQRAGQRGTSPSLIRSLRSAGIHTALIRDTSSLVGKSHDASAEFDQVVVIERGDDDSTARVFGAARRWIDREATGGRFLLFIDCYGAHPPWYPAELEDDGDEFEEAETADDADDSLDAGPAFNSRAEHESSETDDASNLARQAYAAVVTHVDSEFGSFIDYLRCRPEWEQLAVAVTSDCGASLGDAASAAVGEGQLHEGRTHLPLVLRVPGAHDPGSRTAALVQPIDLLPTVGEALGAGAPDTHGRSLLPIMRMQTRTVRDHALMVEPGHGWSIRTPAWHLILPQRSSVSDAISEPGLFVQPDDRWDRNDVAKQYPEVSEQLEQRLRARIGEP